MSGTTSLAHRSRTGVESVLAATVSGDFFSTLGTTPILGRTIAQESEPNVVISHRLWQQLFNGSVNVLGRSITLSDSANIERIYTIVGVMPPEFQLPYSRTDLWRTLAFARATRDGRVRELVVGGHQIYARIRDDVPFETARADATQVVDIVLKPHFTTSRIDIYAKVTPLNAFVRGTLTTTLWVLMGAVTLVLLVACANVANLVLARQASRAREISVRLALGSQRARLVGYLMLEVAAVATIGASLGLIAAIGGVRILRWLQPAQLPRRPIHHRVGHRDQHAGGGGDSRGDDPLGQTLQLMGKQVTIVGVAENVKYTGIASAPESVIYLPFAQMPLRISVVFARTDGDPMAIASQVRTAIRSYDPDIGVPRVQSLTWLISDSVSQPRLRAMMLSAIALTTLLIAAIGLYGVVSYSTAKRTTEIGIRMAIGAPRADVMRLVLGEGTRLAIAGVVLGLGLAWWSGQVLASFLYGVTATDLVTFGGSAVCLSIVALIATILPAWRAARIDPATALRAE